jgi:hypothetical protein
LFDPWLGEVVVTGQFEQVAVQFGSLALVLVELMLVAASAVTVQVAGDSGVVESVEVGRMEVR